MARLSIITELTAPTQPDLTQIVGNERAIMVSQLLNSSRDYLYITNCRNIFERIRFELLPVSQKQLFLVDIDETPSTGLFRNPQLNEIMRQAHNILLNVHGDFPKNLRDKFIVYSMSSNNVNLNLLVTSYLISNESKNVLVYPNGVHNVVISAVSNELNRSGETNYSIISSKNEVKPLYLELLNLYGLNAYELNQSISIEQTSLIDITFDNYSKVYIEHGIGFSKDDVLKVIEIAERAPQLHITNHKVLYNFTLSDIQMGGVITDEILAKLQSRVKAQYNAQQTVAPELVHHSMNSLESSTISTNPLD